MREAEKKNRLDAQSDATELRNSLSEERNRGAKVCVCVKERERERGSLRAEERGITGGRSTASDQS